jgi:hypothetical protein
MVLALGLTVTENRSQRRRCRAYGQKVGSYVRNDDYGQEVGSNVRNDDSFALSIARYGWGFFYSYQQGSTGVTEGPRILLLQDIWSSGYMVFFYNKQYNARYETRLSFPDTAAYEFELSIGQDDNGGVVWLSSEDGADGNIEIDPSVVHLSFSNGATYNVYNDTVFFISYAFTGNELQVEERVIDLSGISSKCGMKHLFQRNADLKAFDAQWRTGTHSYSLPESEYYSKENDPT